MRWRMNRRFFTHATLTWRNDGIKILNTNFQSITETMSDTKKSAGQTAKKTAKPTPELMMACEVIGAQADGRPLKIGQMICGRGARTVQPKSKADELVKLGWVKILGTA